MGFFFLAFSSIFYRFQEAIPTIANTSSIYEDWQFDYLKAQHDGHFKKDCSEYQKHCPFSLFETS
jgi:hypothetical protein